MRFLELDRCHDVPGHTGRTFRSILADQMIEGSELFGAPATGVHELAARLNPPRKHANHRQVTEMLFRKGLEYERGHGLRGVRLALHFTAGESALWRPAFQRRG